MSASPFDVYFSPQALEDIRLQEGVDAYHARVNGAHIRSVYQNIPEQLNLFFHKFGNYFTILLADALSENDSLEALGLELNHIGNRGAKALSWALSINRSVMRVDLSSNHIGAEGVLALARGPMRHNRTIVSWNLSENMNRARCEPFSDVEKAYREVIASLKLNKAVLEYHGPYERELQATLHANRLRSELLADIALHAPGGFTRQQLLDFQESYGAVYCTLKSSGFTKAAITKIFARVSKSAAAHEVCIRIPAIPHIRETVHLAPSGQMLLPPASSAIAGDAGIYSRKSALHS